MNVLQPAHPSICADALDARSPVADGAAWRRIGALHSQAEARDDARAILYFLRSGLSTRDIDPAQPVWVIDLAPGDGERAWLVLRHLAERAPRAPMLRYLACCVSEAQRAMLMEVDALRAQVRAGRLVIADEEEGFGRYGMRNPAMVLAHGACASREQASFACHYGKLLAGAPQADGQIEWRPLPARDGLGSLLAVYRRAINSAPLSLPVGFMRCMQSLLAATDGRMLIRASDAGAADLIQIRGGMLAAAGVNFEALARWHRALGATVHQSQHDDRGRVLQLAVHDRRGGQLRASLAEMLELPHPDVRAAAVSAIWGVGPDSASYATWVEQVQADPRLVPACADVLLTLAGEVQGAALGHWRELLSRLSGNCYPGWRDLPLSCSLASLAMHLEDWGQARRLLQQALHDHGDRALCRHMLAECLERTGELEAARASLSHARQTLPEGSPAHEELGCAIDRIAQRLARQQACSAFLPAHACDGPLRLMLLDEAHAADFFFQYRDPQIGLMARLPAFADVAGVREWIAARARQADRLDCAVMHAERGFVGVVSAHWSAGDAFMHFWIGVDHQGLGFSSRAAACLMAMLRERGVACVFTAVYPDNHRSMRSLDRLRFAVLPLRAARPDADMRFFVKTLLHDGERRDPGERLRAFSKRTGSAFSFPDGECQEAGCSVFRSTDREGRYGKVS